MRSLTLVIPAALSVAAPALVPVASGAGESPYNPNPAPHAVPDMSYFCVAGNVGNFHTLYISDVHHLDRAQDPNTQPALDQAWMQAIRGQRYPFNAHCLFDLTAHVQALRQSVLAQPHAQTVNIRWQYGQGGPAVASN